MLDLVLDADDLTEADEAILGVLSGGRVIVPYVADETGYSPEYIRSRLNRLMEHGHVKRVYKGLYEIDTDPREDTDD